MNAQEMLFTRSAASRILGDVLPHHVSLEVWDKVAIAKVKGRKPRFVSKKDFYQDFVDARKERAHEVTLHQQTDTEWIAHSENSDRQG
ncbi:MAG: hypothetical protein HC899_37230, partial [Leptolyngbyaceae cyanobacterium SM1_4_3]|nr:hypothetical protein [Leptolyngbyaceae cyanobacterium SM1_4_3]